ncbi:nesprin-2 isoform X1 [Thalassophryne amazonica]|uniref:nesprin-2 isoform X1 n=1 Tax=Thalassophryne amazonica TaxID=390379 RepID=UPI00147238D5|nr:nesprin-2 isoform X1 [Thalassophryne amazonica]
MVAVKGQITKKMAECSSSLQMIQDVLLGVRGSDAADVLTKLKEVSYQLQMQDEQAKSLLDDLHVMSSIASPENLQTLTADGIRLQEDVGAAWQLLSQVEEQTRRDIEAVSRIPHGNPELTPSSQEPCCRMEELQHQTTQSHTLHPCTGTAEESWACLLTRLLQGQIDSLQKTLRSMAEHSRELSKETSSTSWSNTCWTELESCSSSLMAELNGVFSRLEERVCTEEHFGQLMTDCHQTLTSLQEMILDYKRQKEHSDGSGLQVLLQELRDAEKEFAQLAALQDSIKATSTFQVETSDLQNHQRSLDGYMTEILAPLKDSKNHRVEQIMEEASRVQRDLNALVEDLGKLSGNCEALLDGSHLKDQLSGIQDCVRKLSEEATFRLDLQTAGESTITQEILPNEIHFSVDVTDDDLNSAGSVFLLKMQECTENTSSSNGQVNVQPEPSASSQMGESMEPERTAQKRESDLGDRDAAGGSQESQNSRSTLQDMLPEIQNLVQRSNIANRTLHIDLNAYLDSCPGEPEIRLARTVQKVLACRYHPAQLSVTAMAKQLKEAEDYRCSVQDQVAALSNVCTAAVCDPGALKSIEEQCSAALLDASATVQVKEAQLDQVKQYHRHLKIARAFVEVLATEKKNCDLQTLGSSACQAEKLSFLQQTMKQKKGMLDTLLQLSSHLSAHLSDSESSGALLAQLGDVQEEWRLLEGSIKRSLWLASNATSQYGLIVKEAKHLQAKLEALQESNLSLQSSQTIPVYKKTLEYISLGADLKLYIQLHLHLQSWSDALGRFSLGRQEKDEIKRILEELGSSLSVTRSKLDSSAGTTSKVDQQLRSLIIWAKQADHYIAVGTRLALFPEEARIQIAKMKKFQIDVLSRQAKMQTEVEMIKASTSEVGNERKDQVLISLLAIEKLYEAAADSLDRALIAAKVNLQHREELLCKLASTDAWLAERLSERHSCHRVENASKADPQKLEIELRAHKSTIMEIESHLTLLETLAESCKVTAVGLRPGESRYLVNRLSGLWMELDGWLAHEKAACWELEELIREQISSYDEFSTILSSLKQISDDLEQQRFPLTHGSIANIGLLKHMLIEYQCQIQDLQHCQEAKRSVLLGTIGELQDRCKALSCSTVEQEKYLQHRRQMEESQDIAKSQIQRAKDKTVDADERFRLCQTLLVEFPLMKIQCQDTADQLEAIAQELDPSELSIEKERIRCSVESLVSWENSVTEDLKSLEAGLLEDLYVCPELSALTKLFHRARVALEGFEPVNPHIKGIDITLQRYWVIWRSLETGMRIFKALGYQEKMNLSSYKELYFLMDATMQECHFQMESLSQARESLKDYQWAAQGAMHFLHNAESTFLSAAGRFLDCNEEEVQTAQALAVLEDGFQAHISHLVELVPQQHCLSRAKTEQLHTRILSQLLVGRAVLEAQAHLRLESLQRCAKSQQSHMQCHEDIQQRLSRFESRLSECATQQVTSYPKCADQQKRVKLLMEDLHLLAEKMEEVRACCPIQGCWVGRDGELAVLWRRWVSLRRGISLHMARAEQRGEEWKDITASLEQSCTFLASLQAEVPDSCTPSFTLEDPCEMMVQAEMHQAVLEEEQQALASLEHRLEHALTSTSSENPISSGYVGKTLAKIQENVRSLTERNLLVMATEEAERRRVHDELEEVEQHVVALLSKQDFFPGYPEYMDLRNDLSSQKDKLKCIKDGVQNRYSQIPADIKGRIQDAEVSLQTVEEEIAEKFDQARKLAVRVEELSSGLLRVKVLLEQRSPTVEEAQNVLKHVWDKLDTWHSHLILLENEVQDLAVEQSDQAQLLMDQLMRPQQLYQEAAQMAERRTSFLSKIPACLQEFEDIHFSATCWLEEAQSWLGTPCSYATARSLQSHANSLQLLLDDSERIRTTMRDFKLVLDEISEVCDMSTQEERLMLNDHQVHKMQCNIITPLEDILHAVAVVDATEAELKTMEKNVAKIATILDSVDNCGDSPTEQLHNLQVVLANIQSMQRTLEEMERYKGELHLPKRVEENPVVFCRARLLLQSLQNLEGDAHQRAMLLKTSISKEEETEETDLDVAMVTAPAPDPQHDESPGKFVKTVFVVSNSEDDEEDDDHHSSSSDTLTCSTPEDPEKTLHISDVLPEDVAEIMQLSDLKASENLSGCFRSEVDPSFVDAGSVKTGLESMESGCEIVEIRLTSQESRSGSEMFHEELHPESVSIRPSITAGVLTDHSQSTGAASPDQSTAPKRDACTRQAAAAVEGTRLIPARPTTPFTRALDELMDDGDEHQSGSNEVSNSLVEEPHQEQESSGSLNRSTGDEEKQTEQQRWSRLHQQISEKLAAVKKVQEMQPVRICSGGDGTNEKVSEREVEVAQLASVALQRTYDAVTILQKLQHTKAVYCGLGAEEELHEAVRTILVCLSGLLDLVLTSGRDDPELRPLPRECVSSELLSAAEMLKNLTSEVRTVILNQEPESICSLTCLQECLLAVQAALASTHSQLDARVDAACPQQEPLDIFSEELCNLDSFDLVQAHETVPRVKEPLSLEQCVLARHLRARPEEASQSLLEGLTRLVDLGEQHIAEGRTDHIHNRSQLQAVLCRRQTFLQVLRSQLAFVQHLFQQEPEAAACQKNDWAQLDARAKALQRHALEQETVSLRRLQEWSRWEDNYGRLCRRLDELETFISSREQEEEDEDDGMRVQCRLDACQHALVQLDESRGRLGLVLSLKRELQTERVLSPSARPSGGALELRWRHISQCVERELQRCRDIQDRRVGFHTKLVSVRESLGGANKQLQMLSDLISTSEMKKEMIGSHLIKLLDFSAQVEAISVQRTSLSRDIASMHRLMGLDGPVVQDELKQLEANWNQLTTDLSNIQDQLQQRLLSVWPPLEVLSDLQSWLKKLESRLNQETEMILKIKDAAQMNEILQNIQELKAAVVIGQQFLEFLCKSGPQVVEVDLQDLWSKRTAFAEELGATTLQLLDLQRDLESQIRGAEQMCHICTIREKRLARFRNCTALQEKKLKQLQQLSSQCEAHRALLEWETLADRAMEVDVAVQELKVTHVRAEGGGGVTFSEQANCISDACKGIVQQLASLRPSLKQTVEEWKRFESDLRKISDITTRVRCVLQHQGTPLFSLKQAERHKDLLERLQQTAEEVEDMWVSVERSYDGAVKVLHRGTAQLLCEQMEEERRRWKEALKELKEEHVKLEETLRLWLEYTYHRQHLQRRWEELRSSSHSPQQDSQDVKLQDVTVDLQTLVEKLQVASKNLTEHLEPLAANLIQSETKLLSRDILLLSRAAEEKKTRVQDDLKQWKVFGVGLDALEMQTENIKQKLKTSARDTDSLEQVLLELTEQFSSLVDIGEMSDFVTLDDQDHERVRMLVRPWIENVAHVATMYRDVQTNRQRVQIFERRCEKLKCILEKLDYESVFMKPQSYSSLKEMLMVHQMHHSEIIAGQQLLQDLLCDAGNSVEKEMGEISELMADMPSTKKRLVRAVALAMKRRMAVEQPLSQWRLYRHGLWLLWKMLKDATSSVHPAKRDSCTLHRPRHCDDNYQYTEDTEGLLSVLYTLTLEAGGQLCETAMESQHQSRLQSELRTVQEAQEQTDSLLRRRGITDKTDPQQTELSLQHLAAGLRQLETMKSDLSQYMTAGDSSVLEQQLEQLHWQWEELCTKVSLRRQEIADRLNAWSIFNDKNKEFCNWLTQMENKVCHSGELSLEEMLEKLKKDCMEEINLFSENKSHLKQLGEQLLLASDEAKQAQVHGSLQEFNKRWHSLFHRIEARVEKLKATLSTVQQLDKNMSNLRSWLSRIEAELSRPISYSVCHHQEIQRKLTEQQELQRDIEQHAEGIASVLSLCDALLRDADVAGGTEVDSDSLQETSHSLDQRWKTICTTALNRRLRIEETWRLWCKFLDDYTQFDSWLTTAELTAANPNSADVLYTVAKEELKKFEGFQRQVHERLTHLEIVNNQYRRLARENRADRAGQLKDKVHEGNRRWNTLQHRAAAIVRRLKYFTSQREDFEGTRESMLVWLTELDLQLTDVEHFSESDIHHKIQQLKGFQREISLNAERIDGLIVFGEGLIQKSSPQDAAVMEDELEELHSYCQEVFSRLVRFHQRLSQPPTVTDEPALCGTTLSLEGSLELIGRPWLGRSLPATPTHLLTSPLERSGRETPVSVDSLPLEWDHTVDVGGSSSHDDDDEDEEHVEGTYVSALSVANRSEGETESLSLYSTNTGGNEAEDYTDAPPTLTSTPLKLSYLHLMSECSGSIEDLKRVSMILDDEDQLEELGLMGLTASDKQSGVIERWELLQAQSRSDHQADPQTSQQLTSDLEEITSWLKHMIPELDRLQQSDPPASIEDLEAQAKELKEMEKMVTDYKPVMLSLNLKTQEAPALQQSLASVNHGWSRACTGLQLWDTSLRKTLMRCQEFHGSLHSLVLWLSHAESRCYAVDISCPDTPPRALRQHHNTLTDLKEALQRRQAQQTSLQALWSQLQPQDRTEEIDETREKLHVTGNKLKTLLRGVDHDLSSLQQRLDNEPGLDVQDQSDSPDFTQKSEDSPKPSATQRETRDGSPPRSFFYRLLRAAFPLHLLLLLLLLLVCLVPFPDANSSCTMTNNFARSFYPMLQYTNGPPPT